MTIDDKNDVAETLDPAEKKPHIIRRLYDWVLKWADSPHGALALFLIAFAESSFFPVPPDVLLIALAIGKRKKAFRFALICSVGSVLGGMFGYYIGYNIVEISKYLYAHDYNFAIKFIDFAKEHFHQQYLQAHGVFQGPYGVWGVAIAGFTPIPYKVFTITAGVLDMPFIPFIVASALSRAARFFLVSTLIYKYGEPIKGVIDKYFNLLCFVFIALLILGVYVVKYVF